MTSHTIIFLLRNPSFYLLDGVAYFQRVGLMGQKCFFNIYFTRMTRHRTAPFLSLRYKDRWRWYPITIQSRPKSVFTGTVCDFRLSYGRVLNRRSKIIAVNRDKTQLLKNSDMFWKPTIAIQGMFKKDFPEVFNVPLSFSQYLSAGAL